jgi:hypothetical protein
MVAKEAGAGAAGVAPNPVPGAGIVTVTTVPARPSV